jgi:hypothetical protein
VANTYFCDIRHFMDELGEIPSDLPKPALNLVSHFIKIIEATTNRPININDSKSNVSCRRRPNHNKCKGYINSFIDDNNIIIWNCITCGDNGCIVGWENTIWDKRIT